MPISGAIDDNPVDSHIPLSEWQTWARWNSPTMTTPLAYPSMRDELVRHLRDLADAQHQHERWSQGEGRFDYIVHFLFDDTPEPADAVGYYLHDEAEREALLAVTRAIDAVLAHYGTNVEDRDYIDKPEWMHVVEAASSALATLAARSHGA